MQAGRLSGCSQTKESPAGQPIDPRGAEAQMSLSGPPSRPQGWQRSYRILACEQSGLRILFSRQLKREVQSNNKADCHEVCFRSSCLRLARGQVSTRVKGWRDLPVWTCAESTVGPQARCSEHGGCRTTSSTLAISATYVRSYSRSCWTCGANILTFRKRAEPCFGRRPGLMLEST